MNKVVDRGISQKIISRNDGETITIEAVLVTPTKNNGINQRRYGIPDAQAWLEEAGYKIGKCSSGGRVYNYDYKDSSASVIRASWTFELLKEEVEPVKKVATRKTTVKATPKKETVVKAELPVDSDEEEVSQFAEPSDEEEASQFAEPSETQVKKKTTTRRRRTTKKRS